MAPAAPTLEGSTLPPFLFTPLQSPKDGITTVPLPLEEALTPANDGASVRPVCAFAYTIDRKNSASWAAPPADWPTAWRWPQDILSAQLYGGKPSNLSISSGKLKIDHSLYMCCGESCPSPVADTIDRLCFCRKASWRAKNTQQWADENIELRQIDDTRGIGAIAKKSLPAKMILGEYFGEIRTAADPAYSANYSMQLLYKGKVVANIDGTRIGCWTRFINHSCKPNAAFEWKRVGQQGRCTIVTTGAIAARDEITVGYGSEYWNTLKRYRQITCQCGEPSCISKRGFKQSHKSAAGPSAVPASSCATTSKKRKVPTDVVETSSRKKSTIGAGIKFISPIVRKRAL